MDARPRTLRQTILLLAWPIIVSNISVPLLGLVDTAVLGHLSDAAYLAGVTLGATLFSFLFWGFGFLRMGTTGAVSRAYGGGDTGAVLRLLLQGGGMALVIALLLLLLHPLLIPGGLALLADAGPAREQALLYAGVRIWSAPAVLVNYVLMGWFLAQNNSRFALQMLLLGNGINIVLDLFFVLVLGWQVQGVALASLIADYSVLAAGGWLAFKRVRQGLSAEGVNWRQGGLFQGFRALLSVNHPLMVRTWLLLAAMAWFTARGAAFGSSQLAANAILMQLIMLASYALDGYAHAVETLVGQAEGAGRRRQTLRLVRAGLQLTLGTVLLVSTLYLLAGPALIGLMTGLDEVQQQAQRFLPWAVLIPLLAAASYLFDGVYIGLLRSDVMRNAMLLAFSGFLLLHQVLLSWLNHGLWAAFAGFMLLRSALMAGHFYRCIAGQQS